MLYYGYFRDNRSQVSGEKGRLYIVEFITNNSTTTKQQITLGHPAFVTEIGHDDGNLYMPVKYGRGTCTIITDEYISDLFSTTAKGVKVFVRRITNEEAHTPGSTTGTTMQWQGFVNPNVYNSSFESSYQPLEVECIDGLTMLKYYKYETIGQSKAIVSFLDILAKVINYAGYNYLVVSNATNLEPSESQNIVEKLYITEQNFFERKDDENMTDHDVAWTYAEVLEEICKFLNVTAVAFRNIVYLIDYDAVRWNYNYYHQYNVLAVNMTATLISRANTLSITGDRYADGGQTLSVVEPYNKVSVLDRLYTFDNIIPGLYDHIHNITATTDAPIEQFNSGADAYWHGHGRVYTDPDNTYWTIIDQIRNDQKTAYTSFNMVRVSYYDSDDYTLNRYNMNKSYYNYTDTKTLRGAIIAKFDVKELSNPVYDSWPTRPSSDIDLWLDSNDVGAPNWTNCLMILDPDDNGHISNNNIENYPMLETNSSDFNGTFGGTDCFLVLTGSYYYHWYNEHPYEYPSTNDYDPREGRYAIPKDQCMLYAKLQWGNQYWNGNSWTTTSSVFGIPYLAATSTDDQRRIDATMCRKLQFVNTVPASLGSREKGYYIPIPDGMVLNGVPLLTLYKSYDPRYKSTKSGSHTSKWKHSMVILEQFNIKAVVGDESLSGKNDSDTQYTNIINEEYVNELATIEFKVNTWDNKKPNYSCVLLDHGNEHLDKTHSRGLSTREQSIWYDWTGTKNGYMRQEEHMICRLVNQYSTPSPRLDLTLSGHIDFGPYTIFAETEQNVPASLKTNIRYCIDSWEFDYENCAVTYHLLLKK